MSILPSPSAEPGDSGPCAINAPQRHDAIGSALVNAFAPISILAIPSDMQAQLLRLDQPIDPAEAST